MLLHIAIRRYTNPLLLLLLLLLYSLSEGATAEVFRWRRHRQCLRTFLFSRAAVSLCYATPFYSASRSLFKIRKLNHSCFLSGTRVHSRRSKYALSRQDYRVQDYSTVCRLHMYTVSQKVWLLTFVNNSGKCEPIFKILSPIDLHKSSLCTHYKDFHHACNISLHYFVKDVADFDSILNKLLTCSWGHFEHLIYHSTVVRQTVPSLLTLLTLIDWLNFEICQTTSRSTAERCLFERCCIMVIFFTMIILAQPLFFLGYTSLCFTHI